uniref:Ribosomal protein L6 n=1 Tax=Trebouxia lynnae TaxID=1825957 RepID=A0A5J6DTK7_9CHLO|nr:ribosomal protein L6 [Trebouxia lynnae]
MKKHKKIESQISIPNKVKIEKKEQFLIFSGVLGFTKLDLTKIDPMGLGGIRISKDEKTLFLFGQSKSFFYSFKRLLINKIRGVTVGFLISLRIVGVGYRASIEKNKQFSLPEHTKQSRLEEQFLTFKLGYSHNIKYIVPFSIRAFLLEPTLLCLFGIDKNQVSQVGSKIRAFKAPERYKGKGIRFTTEKVVLSQGKRK